MLYKSKLRGSFGRVYPISLIIVYLLSAIEAFIRWQLIHGGASIGIVPVFSFSLMGFFFLVAGLVQLFRFRIWIYPVLGFLAGQGCILAIFLFDRSNDLMRLLYISNLLLIILLVIGFWTLLSSQERLEANARRLFKLASEFIDETADGFTTRPFSAGRVDVEREELVGFSRFLAGKFITRPFVMGDGISFSFSMNKSVLVIENPQDVSYVSINNKGELSVSIAEADYKQYRSRISFDQLCDSMAGVFTRFMKYYKEGMEHRIITELKTSR